MKYLTIILALGIMCCQDRKTIKKVVVKNCYGRSYATWVDTSSRVGDTLLDNTIIIR
jgi:hypothetical protein